MAVTAASDSTQVNVDFATAIKAAEARGQRSSWAEVTPSSVLLLPFGQATGAVADVMGVTYDAQVGDSALPHEVVGWVLNLGFWVSILHCRVHCTPEGLRTHRPPLGSQLPSVFAVRCMSGALYCAGRVFSTVVATCLQLARHSPTDAPDKCCWVGACAW